MPSPTPSYSESKSYIPRKSHEKDEEQIQSSDKHAIKGNGTLTLAVAVYDSSGKPITDLHSADFGVLVDDLGVEVTAMEKMPDSVELILLLDKSGSLEYRKEAIKKIAEQIVDHIGPKDKVTVVGFGTDSKVTIEQSMDKSAINRAIKKLEMRGFTAVYDAVFKLADSQQSAIRPQALVVISDVIDTMSKRKYQESLAAVERANLVVYSIYVDTLPDAIKDARGMAGLGGKTFEQQVKELRAQYQTAADYVNDIVTLSGGLVFDPTGDVDIAKEMRGRYYLTILLPKDLTESGRHALTVRVKRPGLHVLSKATFVN
jgi:VWFA-related protein